MSIREDEIVTENDLDKTIISNYPYIDIIVMAIEDNKLFHDRDYYANSPRWQTHFYKTDEVYPLTHYNYGALSVNGPCNPYPFLERVYGDKWSQGAKIWINRQIPNKKIVFEISQQELELFKIEMHRVL